MPKIPFKPVFLDEKNIGSARTLGEAEAVLRRHAASHYPSAALVALLTEAGVKRPARWKPRQHLVEGPADFSFHVRMLP